MLRLCGLGARTVPPSVLSGPLSVLLKSNKVSLFRRSYFSPGLHVTDRKEVSLILPNISLMKITSLKNLLEHWDAM